MPWVLRKLLSTVMDSFERADPAPEFEVPVPLFAVRFGSPIPGFSLSPGERINL